MEWKEDQRVRKIIQQSQEDLSALDSFVWNNDSPWYHEHIYLCYNFQLKQKVHLKLHTFRIGGHSGFLKTYHMVKKDFQNPGYYTTISHIKSTLGRGLYGFYYRYTKV
jgi:hypothetical protein